jgi:hypothetical protein
MSIIISKIALQTALHNMLSCRCPVTPETERAVFGYYHEHKDQDRLDMEKILEVAKVNPDPTPLHGLNEFCRYFQDDPLSYVIEHNDVLRFLGSGYHFATVKSGLDLAMVSHPAPHLIGHLMRPCKVSFGKNGLEAVSTLAGHEIKYINMVCPPEVDLEAFELFGVHLGAVITGLSSEQADMLQKHQELLAGIQGLAREAGIVDYKNYQRYGDYAASVQVRISRNYPA